MADSTPAEILTAAADKLDGLLADDRLTPAPWDASDVDAPDGEWTIDSPADGHQVASLAPCGAHPHRAAADAAYIEAMHPGVGRALVALLRAACGGNDIDGYDSEQVERYFGEELRLARAVLGGDHA